MHFYFPELIFIQNNSYFLYKGHITVLKTFYPAFNISFCLFVCLFYYKMPFIYRFYCFILILNLDLLDQYINIITSITYKRGTFF